MKLFRRKWLVSLVSLAALFVLVAPTLVSRTKLGHSIFFRTIKNSGVDIEADSVEIGWTTPLRLSGVTIGEDTSVNDFHISHLTTDLTLLDFLGLGRSKHRDWVINSVRVKTSIEQAPPDLVKNLNKLLKIDRSISSLPRGRIRVQDIELHALDSVSAKTWVLSKADAVINWEPRAVDAQFSCQLSDSEEANGSLKANWAAKLGKFVHDQEDSDAKSVAARTSVREWKLDLVGYTVPLSTALISSCGLPKEAALRSFCETGSISGKVSLSQSEGDAIDVIFDDCSVLASIPSDLVSRADTSSQLTIAGALEGAVSLAQDADSRRLNATLVGKDFRLSNEYPRGGKRLPTRPPQLSYRSNSQYPTLGEGEFHWLEPDLALELSLICPTDRNSAVIETVKLKSECGACSLAGKADWDSDTFDLELRGQSQTRMNELANRLSAVSGIEIQLEGTHVTPVQVCVQRDSNGTLNIDADMRVGWDSGEIAAVKFGSASVPLQVDNNALRVIRTAVPVGNGHVNLAGDLYYLAQPPKIQIPSGELFHNVRMTPEITEHWLRFIAPPVADVRGIDGLYEIEIDDAKFILGDPLQHRASGRLRVKGADLTMSPMIQELLTATKQKLSQAHGKSKDSIGPMNAPKVRMPPQTIEFDLAGGRVTHQKIVLEIDSLAIEVRGDVTLDNQLDMVAKVPLDLEVFGPELRGKADQHIEMTVYGSVFHPEVDEISLVNHLADLVVGMIVERVDRSVRAHTNVAETIFENARILTRLNRQVLKFNEGFLKVLDK